MQRTSLELLDALHAAYNARDAAAAAALYLPDGRHAEATQDRERTGRDDIAQGLRGLFTAMPDVRWTRTWALADGEQAAAGYELTATAGGAPVRLAGVHRLVARDGAIAATADWWDRAQLQAQLPPRTPALAFAHACRLVEDLERAEAFYARFGLEPRRRFTDGDGHDHVFLAFRGQDEHLELVAAAPGAPAPAPHIGWRTSTLDTVLADAAAGGVEPEAAPRSTPAARLCFLRDPDGHLVELIEPILPAS
jgi:catechol 2,3-dioxygenase-like lactoylglutathione lyase family enzyme/ketosteroid isomerase-like protein